jgi:hypothetical protein
VSHSRPKAGTEKSQLSDRILLAGGDRDDPSSRRDRRILPDRQNRASDDQPIERRFGEAAQELFAPKALRDSYVSRFDRVQGASYEDCCDPDWSVGASSCVDASNSSALARFRRQGGLEPRARVICRFAGHSMQTSTRSRSSCASRKSIHYEQTKTINEIVKKLVAQPPIFSICYRVRQMVSCPRRPFGPYNG